MNENAGLSPIPSHPIPSHPQKKLSAIIVAIETVHKMSYPNCQFYCLTFNNKNQNNMMERFRKLGIDCLFYDGVPHSDERLARDKARKRQWSITYGHLDILHNFYRDSDKQYAVVCENDICIHHDFPQVFKKVLNDFQLMGLDLMLLSYLLPYQLDANGTFAPFTLKARMPEDAVFKYRNYPQYVYGTQMYLVTKEYARELLFKCYHDFAGTCDRGFMLEKLFLATQKRAIIYPMLAIENDEQPDPYHQLCRKVQSRIAEYL
jgi:hypothetical protein